MEYLKREESGDRGIDIQDLGVLPITLHTRQQMDMIRDLQASKQFRDTQPNRSDLASEKEAILALPLVERH